MVSLVAVWDKMAKPLLPVDCYHYCGGLESALHRPPIRKGTEKGIVLAGTMTHSKLGRVYEKGTVLEKGKVYNVVGYGNAHLLPYDTADLE